MLLHNLSVTVFNLPVGCHLVPMIACPCPQSTGALLSTACWVPEVVLMLPGYGQERPEAQVLADLYFSSMLWAQH
jgi:hypothetical protein